MMNNTTLKLVIGNKPLSNGNHTIYLRITKNRQKKEISLGMQCKKKDFENELFKHTHPQYKIENELLLKLKVRANDIVREYRLDDYDFTLNEFDKKYRGVENLSPINVSGFFDEIIGEMKKAGRMGNARAYTDTKVSLMKFKGNGINLKEITPTFLEKFEVSLREKGNQDGGIAFKMRELRALYNTAIRRSLISRDYYPFDLYKISKLKAKKDKKALSIEEFKRIRDLDLSEYPHLVEAHNYFIFSFYSCGINFVDMMKLKWSDIRSGRIFYTRSKTKGQFSVEIIDKARVIIDYYKSQNRTADYVFPILLSNNLTPTQIENRKHKVLGRCNLKLKLIAQLAEVERTVTFYVARHSFATIHKQIGTNIGVISELMGHSNVGITEAYLKRHDSEILDKENRKLSDL